MSAEAPAVTIQSDEDKKTHKRRTVLGGSAGLALLSTAAALAGCGSSGNGTTSADKAPSGATKPGISNVYFEYPEVADNHRGTQLFGSPEGAAVPDGVPGEIQYGAHVLVKCVVPNRSDMSSVNDFYFIVGPEAIKGTFAPADTFANGGPMGPNPDTIDPRVPQC